MVNHAWDGSSLLVLLLLLIEYAYMLLKYLKKSVLTAAGRLRRYSNCVRFLTICFISGFEK